MSALTRRIRTLEDVVAWRLCCGCGACAYAATEGSVQLANIEDEGIRPHFTNAISAEIGDLTYCPGYEIKNGNSISRSSEADRKLGQVLEYWEGYAADQEMRFKASSGGFLSALALYCLEREGMKLVVHTAMDEKQPWLNKTVVSRTRAEILERTGSRYAPSSPCEFLQEIEKSDAPCVFIGKPCDVYAVSLLRRNRPRLDRNLGLVLSLFCAGTPSTRGTHDLIRSAGGEISGIQSIRYRGNGWPGNFTVQYDNGSSNQTFSYKQSWGKLTSYRQLRCKICPDGLGRWADIACGDAWERYENDENPGLSIALVRTSQGKILMERAIKGGYLIVQSSCAADVIQAQQNLLKRNGELFGRMAVFMLFGLPFPKYRGFSLFRSWIHSGISAQLRSVVGTIKRVIAYRWYQNPVRRSPAAF